VADFVVTETNAACVVGFLDLLGLGL